MHVYTLRKSPSMKVLQKLLSIVLIVHLLNQPISYAAHFATESALHIAQAPKVAEQMHADQMAILEELTKQHQIYKHKQKQADCFLQILELLNVICGDRTSDTDRQEAVLMLGAWCDQIQQVHIRNYLQSLQEQLLAEFCDHETGQWQGTADIGRARCILFGYLEKIFTDKHVQEFLMSVNRKQEGSYAQVLRNLRKVMYAPQHMLEQARTYESSRTISLEKVASNPINKQMLCMIKLFKLGNREQAEQYVYINNVENRALRELFFALDNNKNEFGVYQKFERDTAWVNLPQKYKQQLCNNKWLRKTVNEAFAQRAIQKQQIATQFGIPAYHTECIDKFLYKLVSYADDVYTQTDFLVQAAQEYKEVAELFCLPNGLFKKFHAYPWAQQFMLNKELPAFMQVKVLAGANNILSLPQEALSSEAGQRALQYIDYAARATSADEAAVYTVLADALQAHLARGVTLPSALHEVNFLHHAGHEQHLQEFTCAHDYAVELSQSIYTATMPNGLLKEFNDEAYAKRFKYQEGYSLAEHQEFADLLNKLFEHYQQEKQNTYRQGKEKAVMQAISYAIRAYEWPQERAYKIVAQGTLKALNGAVHLQFLENQENLLAYENRGAQSAAHQAEYAQAERLAEKIIQQEEQAAANKAFADSLLCEMPQENGPWPLCD